MKTLLAITTALLMSAPLAVTPAAAQDQKQGYTVNDVVKHFTRAPNLGKPRALCIGAPSECGAAEPEPVADAGAFNLRVQFEFGSSRLTPEAQDQLNIFAEAATGALSSARFKIDGHTDAHGADQANLVLSQSRAGAVVDYLVARGVDAERLVPSGFGEAEPAHEDPYHGDNRRVEASLVE
ncbi:MAG: OmpA family protein [Pseudomonadota bacterium]